MFDKTIKLPRDRVWKLWAASDISWRESKRIQRQPYLEIKKKINVRKFFSQKQFPYLWPKDRDYVAWANSRKDKQLFLKVQWTIAYLNHPDLEILVEMVNVLPEIMFDAPCEVILEHAKLLEHPDERVRVNAAKNIGKYKDVVAILENPKYSFCHFAGPDETDLLPKISALITIGNEAANDILGNVFRGLLWQRKSCSISELEKNLERLRQKNPTDASGVTSALAELQKNIFGYGWGEGGVGKEDKPWDEAVFRKFLDADKRIIREYLEQLVVLLSRFSTKIEDNLVAQMLDRLDPSDFLPLIKRYVEILEAVLKYLRENQLLLWSGLNDELRSAESGADVKWVRDWQARVKDFIPWENAVWRLKQWETHWSGKTGADVNG